jgi:SNF2 family DNA or RNA helicase
LEQISFDIIVADESHNIQEGSSIQTQVAIALSKKAYRRYISSGTAILGDPRDIYTQAKFLSPAVITEDWLSFESNHLVKSKWNKHQVVGYKNMDILNRRIGRVSISRTKDECLDLPDRSIIDVKVPMSAEQIVAYNMLVDAQNTSLTLLMNNEEVALQTQTAVTRLQKLAQVTSGFLYEPGAIKALCDGCPHLTNCVAQKIQPYTQACHIEKEEPQRQTRFFKENPRLERLEELVDSIFQTPDAKVIIWAWYEAELTQIKDLFERRKWKYHTPGGDTQSKIREFNTKPEIRAWVAQEATGVGITLNAAQYMIYYSAGFSLGHYLQSIDRNYRIGQKNKVIVYRFVADGTIDEYKLQALDQKKDLSTMLTKKLSCATCSKRANCLTNNIELFEPGCIYQKTSTKIVVKAERIENDEDNLGE